MLLMRLPVSLVTGLGVTRPVPASGLGQGLCPHAFASPALENIKAAYDSHSGQPETDEAQIPESLVGREPLPTDVSHSAGRREGLRGC